MSHPHPPSSAALRHPPGLASLFLVEMWERFAFYGARAVLVLFLVAPVSQGGLGLSQGAGTAVYGLYGAAALLFGLFGGWIADRFTGAQRAVAIGAWLIVAGNLLVATGAYRTTAWLCFLGLLLDASGTGLLKPNATVIVSQLYPRDALHREGGFLIFYTGINVGALFGSLVIPLLAARFGWWAGFLATVAGMTCGVVQFAWTRKALAGAGSLPTSELAADGTRSRRSGILLIGCAVLLVGALVREMVLDPVRLSQGASFVLVAIAVGAFAFLMTRRDVEPYQRIRLLALLPLFLGVALYLVGYQQGGSSLSLFIDRYTDRHILGWDVPTGAFQSVIPLATIILAPLFAALWLRLGRRGVDPSPGAKFALSLLFLGTGFLVVSLAARVAVADGSATVWWIVGAFVLHTVADLCIAPIGLSAVTRLSPPHRMGLTLGLWFVATALGNNVAGLFAGQLDLSNPEALAGNFLDVFKLAVVASIAMLAISPLVTRLGNRGPGAAPKE